MPLEGTRGVAWRRKVEEPQVILQEEGSVLESLMGGQIMEETRPKGGPVSRHEIFLVL